MNNEAVRSILPWIALGAIATVGLVYISDGPWQMYIYASIGVILVSVGYIVDAKVEKESQASIAIAFVFLALLWPAVALTFIFAPLFRDRSR